MAYRMTLEVTFAVCSLSNSHTLNFFLLENLEFYWNFARSPVNFMVLWRLL